MMKVISMASQSTGRNRGGTFTGVAGAAEVAGVAGSFGLVAGILGALGFGVSMDDFLGC